MELNDTSKFDPGIAGLVDDLNTVLITEFKKDNKNYSHEDIEEFKKYIHNLFIFRRDGVFINLVGLFEKNERRRGLIRENSPFKPPDLS